MDRAPSRNSSPKQNLGGGAPASPRGAEIASPQAGRDAQSVVSDASVLHGETQRTDRDTVNSETVVNVPSGQPVSGGRDSEQTEARQSEKSEAEPALRISEIGVSPTGGRASEEGKPILLKDVKEYNEQQEYEQALAAAKSMNAGRSQRAAMQSVKMSMKKPQKRKEKTKAE